MIGSHLRQNSDRPIAITMGDPAGIGPEIAAKAFAAGLPAPAVLIGDPAVMARTIETLGLKLGLEEVADTQNLVSRPAIMPVLVTSRLSDHRPVGYADARAGRAAYDAVLRAADLAKDGAVRAMVTGPINKAALHLAGCPLPGHTEILAQRAGNSPVAMMLAGDDLRVLLVSIHVPLSEAIRLVTPRAQERAIGFAQEACLALGIEKPRIAVAGLNPHAGEEGLMGHEDEAIIRPAIARARAKGIDASGPWPPDTIFMRARRGEFDIVVAQYHDQGLIPVKYLGIERAVNVTVGLPFIRTSVDHGTAFDIAGKGMAKPASLLMAFEMALQMASRRECHAARPAFSGPALL